MGYQIVPEDYLADLLLYPGEDVPRSFVPADIPVPRFDRSAMRDIDTFVRLFGSELMFVYGENDPTTAEAFRLGPQTKDSFLYVVPGANHGARLASLPTSVQEKPSRLSAAGQVCNKTASDAASSGHAVDAVLTEGFVLARDACNASRRDHRPLEPPSNERSE